MQHKKFEYQIVDIPQHDKVCEYEKWLNFFGGDGWEAVYQDFRKVGNKSAAFVCFKRPILNK